MDCTLVWFGQSMDIKLNRLKISRLCLLLQPYKYIVFFPEIRKNVLIDRFLRIPAVIEVLLVWVLAHVIVLARDMLLYCVLVLWFNIYLVR